MSEITLEKIDIIRERTGATYSEAKEALQANDGDVVETLIYLEKNSKSKKEEIYTTTEEFFDWLKSLISQGNVNRIRIKKDEKVVVDVPVNAGVATGIVGIVFPPLLAILGIGTIAAVFTNFTIEITKNDGSVDVVNKVIKNTASNVKEKVSGFANEFKEKFSHDKEKENEENVYKYTVKFEDIDENK